jgi:DnaJ-class molecular chaperone
LDKYIGKNKELIIDNVIYSIPIYNSQYTLNINNNNIMINIECDTLAKDSLHQDFKELGNNNLLFVQEISLYKYLYGGDINISHLDNEQINIKFNNFIESVPIIELKNKGLPYLLDNNKLRGNLYVYFIIDGINDNLNNDYNKKVKEIVKNLFD